MNLAAGTSFVFATLAEAEPLLRLLEATVQTDTPYPSFSAPARRATVMLTGMGLAAADAAIEAMLARLRPALVVNAGIAGALHDGLAIGELRRVSAVAEAADSAVAVTRFLELAPPGWARDLDTARLVSRQAPLFDPAIRARLATTADLVDMEGERIARRCAARGVPCALLKAVSDHADDRATLLRNLEHSSHRLAECLVSRLRQVPVME